MENTGDTSGALFPSKENKSKMFCCVYGCSSKSCKNPDVRFHYFPKQNANFVKIKNAFGDDEKIDCRKMWQRVLKIGKEYTTEYMQVCSLHFKKSDYFSPDLGSKRKRCLKKNAVPSCNLPYNGKNTALIEAANNDREARRLRRDKIFSPNQPAHLTKPNTSTNSTSVNSTYESDDLRNLDILDHNANSPINPTKNDNGSVAEVPSVEEYETAEKRFIDIGIQIRNGDFVNDFCDILQTEKELNTLTGIVNFDVLNTVIDVVKLAFPKYESERMHLRSKIIMTFVKLKHNLSYAILRVIFKCSSDSHCRKTILHMIDMLYICLKEGIPFPDKDEISRNIPVCFNDFKDVRVVLDCTEIFIQRPKNLCCQQTTYSRYKSAYTIKFMTGVTPGGMLSYISPMYGGRASDDAIFEQSKILDLLDKGESVMVDKGFRVDKLCKDKDIHLIRPPFKKEQLQFSREESRLNAKIARARVHVERSNQRLKVFKVLGSRMPIGLVKKGKEIITIIGAVVNLSSPILKNDKFMS